MKNMYITKTKSYNCYGLLFLIILNMIDGLITYIGLKSEFYIEMNPILSNIYNYNPSLFLLVKIIIPTIVLTVLFLNLKSPISKITKIFIYISNIVYLLLDIYHVVLLFKLI